MSCQVVDIVDCIETIMRKEGRDSYGFSEQLGLANIKSHWLRAKSLKKDKGEDNDSV
jgi:hypothetical protein